MKASRRALMPLAAAAATAAALFFAMRGPDPDAPSASPGRSVPALSLTLPPAALASAAAVSAAAPPIAALPSAPPVGSEGYGPHIERAQSGDDSAAAWQAVQWLQQCAANERQRESFEQLRNQGHLPQDAGGVMSLLAAVQADDAWGLSDAERLGFHAALKQLADEPGDPGSLNLAKSLVLHSALRFKTPPTAEQQAAAQLAGQEIVARLHAAERT